MRISDWSSDVCSSDLRCADADARPRLGLAAPGQPDAPAARGRRTRGVPARQSRARRHLYGYVAKLGNRGLARSVDRKSVVEGKRVSVRVDLGGRRIIKKKQNEIYSRKHNHYSV